MLRYTELDLASGHNPLRCIYWGPMFSGKTTELQSVQRRFQHAGIRVALFNPTVNTRDAELVHSHDGHAVEATPFSTPSEVLAYVDTHKLRVVLIEEAQFVDGLLGLCDALWERGVHVFMAALNEDHRGQPWPGIRDILHTCQVHQTFAVCKSCGSMRASHSVLRAIDSSDNQTVIIGGEELYQALCSACLCEISKKT